MHIMSHLLGIFVILEATQKERLTILTIKAIVVDMDGTFLNEEKAYDRERFLRLKEMMNERGMHFVVASGNQYDRLIEYFPDFGENLFYIADNGADVRYHGDVLASQTLPQALYPVLIDYIQTHFKQAHMILTGKKGVYASEQENAQFLEMANFFYPKIDLIDFSAPINDEIFKFGLNFPVSIVHEAVAELKSVFGDKVQIVASGHGAIDVVSKDAGKEVGIQKMLEFFELEPQEIAVFGDNYNDIGMFKLTPHSYAPSNAVRDIKILAKEIIGSNEQQAVLEKMETLINLVPVYA
ncbi:FMN hydrolase/5-amino-6-(5-phospho-D-ribitylamino)uracil phosphatase [Enterococcus sp. AZ150]|uniref:Cof-like hydrolase n=1 Tax=Enterococcus sulfureus ATCC 49903 TaxID=1140003 RepID=S0P7A4_9ENTE|nr:hypothetical protein I573_00918 [Enterococcus sulfureus ATCC 49903]